MRVLFTVALAVAILAVVLPAVQVASLDRAESQTSGAVERLVEVGRALAAGNDALADRRTAARQAVALDLPTAGVANRDLATFRIGPPNASTRGDGPADGDATATRIVWRVQGGQRHVTQVDGLRLRGTNGGQFQVGAGGRQELLLRLRERAGRRVVTVETV